MGGSLLYTERPFLTPTPEQSAIIEHIKTNLGLVKVSSVAGSGKTSLLTMIARLPFVRRGLYLAYTKTVASEAQRKFPDTVTCCTTHSLAYGPTVRGYKLTLGKLSYRDVNLKSYDEQITVLSIIREFCLSSSTDLHSFITNYDYGEHIHNEVSRIMSDMESGALPCTHEFYLKMFHILLADGVITFDPFDIIMLDEAGDLNEVTLAIFLLLPATRKIMVGDSLQNIFGFNHTIDCFVVMANQGTDFAMTQSFRVSDTIAARIEKFCNRYIDPTMVFRGTPIADSTIKTRAYIARTNATLISKMIELNISGTPYSLTREPAKLFEQVLIFMSLKYKGFISDPSLRYLQEDVDDYYSEPKLQEKHRSLFSYLRTLYPKDPIIEQNIALINRYGTPRIMQAYTEARKHRNHDNAIILGTAHSTKGLEYDEVTIAPDLNLTVSNILVSNLNATYDKLSSEERTELNLYYVACSRARKKLLNALHI